MITAVAFIKFFVLATFGEILGRRIATGFWAFRGIRILDRAIVWGVIGALLSYVIPIYSAGIDFLVQTNRLPVFTGEFAFNVSVAFWKSLWMNLLFAFPFMTAHRITDMLIDAGQLWTRPPFLKTWQTVDWQNMWTVVAPTILWFWIPAHTVTFSLPAQWRVLIAALLGVALGVILGFAKRKAK